MADAIHHLSSNVISGPGTWPMSTGNIILMTIIPPDHPRILANIDPELNFTLDDLPDEISFGNGTTTGAIRLKDKRLIKCGWVVIDHANINAANGMLTALKNIFKESS